LRAADRPRIVGILPRAYVRFATEKRVSDTSAAHYAVNLTPIFNTTCASWAWDHNSMNNSSIRTLLPLQDVRILSLSLNLPGPAALMRCQQMGASCVKLEPPAPAGSVPGASGDPMGWYQRSAYDVLHQSVRVVVADLKTGQGQDTLHQELAQADVLLTSFRPSALKKLGLEWLPLHQRYPSLSQVAIVGAPGARAEEPGHDLTYLAENDLINGVDLPATLYADMAGSLMASEAILKSQLMLRQQGSGCYLEVALSAAAGYLALPRSWGLTQAGAAVGGGHAGYRVYPCLDGRVAVAALEPHFAKALCAVAGIQYASVLTMVAPSTHEQIAAYLLSMSRNALEAIAGEKDIPLYTLAS
jgi:crotonobetainyl-CoA:carnitine CoA-transferase CaiB-like acyl-CoA transferase